MSTTGGDDDGLLDGGLASDALRGRTRKAPSAFRTISEVADELHIPQHVLRFWETRFPQVKPLKRGGGRRYYRPDDIALLRSISHLLYVQGYTIKGVQRLLREGGGALADDIPPAAEAEQGDGAGEVETAGTVAPSPPQPDEPGHDRLADPDGGAGAARAAAPAIVSATAGSARADPSRAALLRDLLHDLEALRRRLDD